MAKQNRKNTKSNKTVVVNGVTVIVKKLPVLHLRSHYTIRAVD